MEATKQLNRHKHTYNILLATMTTSPPTKWSKHHTT